MIFQKIVVRDRLFSIYFSYDRYRWQDRFQQFGLSWTGGKRTSLAISYRLLSILTEWPQRAPPPSIWDNASECSRTHVNRVLMQLFALTDRRSSISALFESVCLYPTTSFPTSHYYLSLDYRHTFRRDHASRLF